jgi:hypothetical protein
MRHAQAAGCTCSSYYLDQNRLVVDRTRCPIHQPHRDLSPMGGGKRWDDGRYPVGWPRHV